MYTVEQLDTLTAAVVILQAFKTDMPADPGYMAGWRYGRAELAATTAATAVSLAMTHADIATHSAAEV